MSCVQQKKKKKRAEKPKEHCDSKGQCEKALCRPMIHTRSGHQLHWCTLGLIHQSKRGVEHLWSAMQSSHPSRACYLASCTWRSGHANPLCASFPNAHTSHICEAQIPARGMALLFSQRKGLRGSVAGVCLLMEACPPGWCLFPLSLQLDMWSYSVPWRERCWGPVHVSVCAQCSPILCVNAKCPGLHHISLALLLSKLLEAPNPGSGPCQHVLPSHLT